MTNDLLIKRLEEDMTELKKEMKEGFASLSEKIDNLDNRFVTRREWEVTKSTQNEAKTDWARVLTLIFGGIAMVLSLLKFK